MSAPSEEFDQLQKLLKLKRYEQPPPRYFNEFSSQVISRLHAESAAGASKSLAEAGWFKRFFYFLERSPVAAGSFAASICALLVGSIVYSEYADGAGGESVANPDGTQVLSPTRMASFASHRDNGMISSTNPVLSEIGFGAFSGGLSIQKASWNP